MAMKKENMMTLESMRVRSLRRLDSSLETAEADICLRMREDGVVGGEEDARLLVVDVGTTIVLCGTFDVVLPASISELMLSEESRRKDDMLVESSECAGAMKVPKPTTPPALSSAESY
mmetsp:Transcript_37379/g.69188  ORF Transcript_37379/g.69188 Transcript_37379/m.69188 type:complete len:118 (+) Transcript_37379:1331-1684(+)